MTNKFGSTGKCGVNRDVLLRMLMSEIAQRLTQGTERKHHPQLLTSIMYIPFSSVICLPSKRKFYLCNRKNFHSTLIIDEMNRNSKARKVYKFKKPSRGSTHGPGPAASTSTSTGNTTDLMPSIPDSDGTTSARAAAGVGVSV